MTESWTSLMPVPTRKYDCQAGLATDESGMQRVVATGGRNGDVTTYLLDVAGTGLWLPGPDLPHEIYGGASVPFGDAFLVAGGYGASTGGYLDTVYAFDASADVWRLEDAALAEGRTMLAAFTVPETYVACH